MFLRITISEEWRAFGVKFYRASFGAIAEMEVNYSTGKIDAMRTLCFALNKLI